MKETLSDDTEIKTYYYDWLYANKWDDIDETHKFQETYNLPRYNHKKQEIWT